MEFCTKISVVMPTYNTELSMLREAVESILNQTMSDFEFIIIDDGSDNGTEEYLRQLSDERIELIRNPFNIGITKSLNVGLKAARGKYVARMDADDISLPTRFEEQYSFMESHPDVAMCGTAVEEFGDKSGIRVSRIKDHDTYRIKTLFYYPGPIHPTMFIRHSVLQEHNIAYDESLQYAQDYALCAEIGRWGKVSVLPEVLFQRRNHQTRITSKHYQIQKECSIKTQKKLLLELLGNVTDEETALHYRYSYEKNFSRISDFYNCASWYFKLIKANNRTNKYPRCKFFSYTWKLLMLITFQSILPRGMRGFISLRNTKLLRKA